MEASKASKETRNNDRMDGPNERGCFRYDRGWMRRDKLGVCEKARKAKRRANGHERRYRVCHARCQGRIKAYK